MKPITSRTALVAVVFISTSVSALAADIYRCTSPGGKVEFSDSPCGQAQKSSVVDARPNSMDNSAVREQLLRMENKKLKEEVAATRPAPATAMQGQVAPARSDSAECRSAKRDVEVATSSIDKNKPLIRARTSAMYIACGVPEPERKVTNFNVGNREDRVLPGVRYPTQNASKGR